MTDDNTQPPAETLAECPFCGGAAELKGANAPEYWVACPGFGCKASTEGFGSKDRAIAAWNRRAALTRRAGGDDAEREALAGYRAAVSFIAADSWDGCSDCVETLKAAWAADWQNDQAADPDETARQLARIRAHRPPVEPRAGGDAIPAGEEGDADWMHVARESVAAALPGSAFADRIMAGLHDDSLEVRAAMRAIDATLAALSEGRSHG